jgi:putative SOS response-associated peptidase YedK
MCGRYEVHTPVEEIARRFDAAIVGDAAAFGPRFNVAPSQPIAAIRVRSGRRRIEAMIWGLVPGWIKNPLGAKPINARADTVFDRPMFRNAIRRRRCLVPADGFFEWEKTPAGKQPWHIGMADRSVLAFGGIWEYRAREGEPPLLTCAILVTSANEVVRGIHERMPVIVRAHDYAGWLDPTLESPTLIAPMLEPYPAAEMRAHRVSKRVNDADNDDPELLSPISVD